MGCISKILCVSLLIVGGSFSSVYSANDGFDSDCDLKVLPPLKTGDFLQLPISRVPFSPIDFRVKSQPPTPRAPAPSPVDFSECSSGNKDVSEDMKLLQAYMEEVAAKIKVHKKTS